MASFYIDYFYKMKDYFHPNVSTFNDHYTSDVGFVQLPIYHGWGPRNKRGTKKLIDYRNGHQCICGVWTDENNKAKYGNFPMTRYSTQGSYRYLYKNRGNCLWSYKTKKFVHMLDTPIADNFKYFLKLKNEHLNTVIIN